MNRRIVPGKALRLVFYILNRNEQRQRCDRKGQPPGRLHAIMQYHLEQAEHTQCQQCQNNRRNQMIPVFSEDSGLQGHQEGRSVGALPVSPVIDGGVKGSLQYLPQGMCIHPCQMRFQAESEIIRLRVYIL